MNSVGPRVPSFRGNSPENVDICSNRDGWTTGKDFPYIAEWFLDDATLMRKQDCERPHWMHPLSILSCNSHQERVFSKAADTVPALWVSVARTAECLHHSAVLLDWKCNLTEAYS